MSWKSVLKLDFEIFADKYLGGKMSGTMAHYDSRADTIRVSLPAVKSELTRYLGKEPTDRQLERAYAQVLAHESGHAADLGPKGGRKPDIDEARNIVHGDGLTEMGTYLDAKKYLDNIAADTELVAYLNQFGDNVFNAIGRFLQHPSVREIDHEKVKEMGIDPLFAEMRGATKVKDRFEYLRKLHRWAAGTTSKNKLRNELVLLELAVAKKFKGKMKTNFPINLSQARGRYTDFNNKIIPKAGRIINQVWGKR
ncbi:MAG: hypothetical protein CL833_04125 [Crocinitomicaceae bacterium]|jgi:hypothetical protein|nr:hypothetical protein [Crocinitomicaceae bacterium]|tara:strand:- start:140 stop:898 length:759 start_codon:yes stop_codon:yes gene_type:complete